MNGPALRWPLRARVLLCCVPLALAASAQAQTMLQARARVFPDAGTGVRAIKRDAAGRYYVLTAPGPAVQVYNAAGQRMAQIAASLSKDASLVFGDDLDLDTAGRLLVADRGANAIKIFHSDGTLALAIPVNLPTAVVALPDGEIAVASMKSVRLVTVFSATGKVLREFGDPTEITERRELNRFLNIGRLATDPDAHIYYAFAYLPEPTLRKYDRYGYAAFTVELTGLEFQPLAQATRREIHRQERGGTPALKPIVTALGVDAATQEVWLALGGVLVHFDPQGNRRGSYRTVTPEGARLEATSVLVEPDRLLLATDLLGIFEFPRPDKTRP